MEHVHTVFYEVFFISEKQTFCYEVFEQNDDIETSAAQFFIKVR